MATRPRSLTYAQKLQDPRWQMKRLEIMKRAGSRCEWCGTDARAESTRRGGTPGLQIHHGFYGKSVEPWEYEDNTLYCLCDDCHEKAETARRAVYAELARIHPKHHRDVQLLLRQVQSVVKEGEASLSRANVQRVDQSDDDVIYL